MIWGGILRFGSSIKEAVQVIKKVTTDEGGKIKAGVQRMQALAQIYSDFGVIRGANLWKRLLTLVRVESFLSVSQLIAVCPISRLTIWIYMLL